MGTYQNPLEGFEGSWMKRKETGQEFAGLKISVLPEHEDRLVKAAIGEKTVRYGYYEVCLRGKQYVIAKSAQQIEELSELVKLEIFHTTLPTLAARSPRGGASSSAATDEYLV